MWLDCLCWLFVPSSSDEYRSTEQPPTPNNEAAHEIDDLLTSEDKSKLFEAVLRPFNIWWGPMQYICMLKLIAILDKQVARRIFY